MRCSLMVAEVVDLHHRLLEEQEQEVQEDQVEEMLTILHQNQRHQAMFNLQLQVKVIMVVKADKAAVTVLVVAEVLEKLEKLAEQVDVEHSKVKVEMDLQIVLQVVQSYSQVVEVAEDNVLMEVNLEALEVEVKEVVRHLTHLVTQQELEQMELLTLVVAAVGVLVELKLEVQVAQE